MKYSYVTSAILALASSSAVFAQLLTETANGDVGVPASPPPQNNGAVVEKVYNPPTGKPNQAPPTTTAAVVNQPPPTPSPSPSSAPSSSGPTGGTQSSAGQICVNFSGGDFHFANAGSWGSKTGQGAGAASQCFGMVSGGAMFICESECNAAGDAAPAKYTKLECNFEGGYPNCDISLVDGFSLPLECTIPGASPEKIGGLVDLTSLTPCPGGLQGDNTCPNTQGYAASEGQVSSFFQNANQPNAGGSAGPGGNYCVWQTCSGPSDTFWNSASNPTISCQVGTRSASKKRDTVDAGVETRNLSDAEVIELDAHVRRHVGGAHAHARAHVKNLL